VLASRFDNDVGRQTSVCGEDQGAALGKLARATIISHAKAQDDEFCDARLMLGFAAAAGLCPPATAKESNCNPGRWADPIASFQKTDRADPPPKGGIVFVGSSSIRLWDLQKSFPDLPAINRGFGGSELCDSVHFFDLLVERVQSIRGGREFFNRA
jgi:hypothetical protein